MALVLKLLWDYRKALGWGAVVIAVALLLWRVSVWHDSHERLQATEARLAAEVDCLPDSACHERLRAAAEAARAEERERQADAQAALEAREEAARKDAAAWRRKYQTALNMDPECAAWARQAIACPL